MIDVDTFARPISDAARFVRRRLPSCNDIELADLVQVGWERVTRYLSGADSASSTLVFVVAKQGMLDAARHWAGNAWCAVPGKLRKDRYCRRARLGPAPILTGLHEWHRSTFLDVDLLIDVKRELLRMPLRQAAAWYSRHMLDESASKLAPEFRVTRGRVVQYADAARVRLRRALEHSNGR